MNIIPKKQNDIKIVRISVANFIIRLEFHPFSKNEKYYDVFYQRREFIKSLMKYLNLFITTTNRKANFTIVFKSEPLITIRNYKLGIVSTPLFTNISSKKLKMNYHISIFQFQIVLRDILYQLVTKNKGFVLHGSALNRGNDGIVFSGHSSAGKSTIIRLLKNTFTPISDDLVFIKKENRDFFIYQTPFIEKQWWIKKENRKIKLTHVFFIQKHSTTFVKRDIEKTKILDLLLEQLLISKETKKSILEYSAGLITSNVSFYILRFKKDRQDLAKVLNTV